MVTLSLMVFFLGETDATILRSFFLGRTDGTIIVKLIEIIIYIPDEIKYGTHNKKL